MKKTPKVSREEYEKQTSELYAQIGRIAVDSEHLNSALLDGCRTILEIHGLKQEYAQIVLAGFNIENSRRVWIALMKKHYRQNNEATEMIDHLADRIDKVNKDRNDTIHRRWWIGWGNEETDYYGVASGTKVTRDLKKGGVNRSHKDTLLLKDILEELKTLSSLVMRMMACAHASAMDSKMGKLSNNFYYVGGLLVGGQKAKPES